MPIFIVTTTDIDGLPNADNEDGDDSSIDNVTVITGTKAKARAFALDFSGRTNMDVFAYEVRFVQHEAPKLDERRRDQAMGTLKPTMWQKRYAVRKSDVDAKAAKLGVKVRRRGSTVSARAPKGVDLRDVFGPRRR